jgi:hypothetical protein
MMNPFAIAALGTTLIMILGVAAWRRSMIKPSVEDVVTRWQAHPVEFVDTKADVETLITALIEATAELIYLRQFGKNSAGWEINHSKGPWRDKARASLKGEP